MSETRSRIGDTVFVFAEKIYLRRQKRVHGATSKNFFYIFLTCSRVGSVAMVCSLKAVDSTCNVKVRCFRMFIIP